MIILVALKSEATPFVNALGLRKWPSGSTYSQYRSERHCVLVTGVGVNQAVAAVAAFLEANPETGQQRWLNVGISGAFGLALGELCWIAKVRNGDAGEERQLALPTGVKSQWLLTTVDRPKMLEKGDQSIYDMELAGVAEHLEAYDIHLMCAKVISDNKRAGMSLITPQYVTDLIRNQVDDILHPFLPGFEA